MNSIDKNYSYAVLLPAVLFISSLPKNCTSNRLNYKDYLNVSNLI
jgi:hypothetical protein